ncbi:MAG: oligosaccharide flippase family protein [Armatimonadetes bacterium]|nr:oligosaccharide flippase family protein [Armatimonadota bacterium]
MAVAAVVISALLSIGKVVGYVRDMVIAYYFGAGAKTDAFYSLYNAVIYNLYTKVEKLMRPTYLPEFVKMRDVEGEEAAWRLASATALLQFAVLLLVATALVAFSRPIIVGLWPNMASDPETLEIAVVMLRIMAPALVFFSLSIMPEMTLHAYRRFTLPAVAEASFRTGLLLCLVAGLYLIWRPDQPTAIYAAAWAAAISGVIRLLVQLPGVARYFRYLRLVPFWREPGVRAMIRLMPPILLGLIFASLRILADSVFAGRMSSGAYTCLSIGRKLLDAPLQVLPLAVSLVVFPFVSQWAVEDDRARMAKTLVGMTRAMAFIFLPAAVMLMVLARPTVSLLFEQGRFTEEDVNRAALALYCYAPALPFQAVEGSVDKWFFALKDTATPNYAGVLTAILHIMIGAVGTFLLRGSLGVIALALTISKGIKVIALYLLLAGRLRSVDGRAQAKWAGRLALAVGTLAVIVWALSQGAWAPLSAWHPPFGGNKVRILALFALVGTVGGLWYVAAAWLFGLEEARVAAQRLGERVRSRLRR